MVFGRFGVYQKKEETLAATSQRPNVATPGQQRKVNKRDDVATLQRHDLSTSRRHRDFCLSIIKSKGDLISRDGDNVRTGAQKTEKQQLGSWEKTLSFCFSSLPINY